MKIFKHMKDGGPESRVHGFFLIEIKSLFSIVLLRFDSGSENAYHNHAFNAISWVIKGFLREEYLLDEELDVVSKYNYIEPSFIPFMTYKTTFHKVTSVGNTWALTFRGPWK